MKLSGTAGTGSFKTQSWLWCYHAVKGHILLQHLSPACETYHIISKGSTISPNGTSTLI